MTSRPFLKMPVTMLLAVLVIYFGHSFLILIAARTTDWQSIREQLRLPRSAILILIPFAIGVTRCVAYHPRYLPKYAGWLSATPWRPGLPLPLGPASLVWEDLLLVVPLAVLARFDAAIPVIFPVFAFVLGHSIASLTTVRGKRMNWFAYSFVLTWSIPLLSSGPVSVVVIALLISVILTELAIRDSLRDFPWDRADSMRDFKRRPQQGISWPMTRVGPLKIMEPISAVTGWSIAFLCGWWLFVLLKVFAVGETEISTPVYVLCLIAAASRWLIYCAAYHPPISVTGRFVTRRTIIPGYDYVLGAPLLMCLIVLILPHLLKSYLPMPALRGVIVAAVFSVALNVGPSVRTWRLTGHHKMMAGVPREPTEPKARMS